jgi:hypothetical protein
MKVNALMVVNAIVAGLFGIGFVLAPAQVLSQYGITTDAPFDLVGQLFGAALIGFAVLTWTARDATNSDAGRAILLALFVADAVGFVVALIGQLGGIVNALGWSTVAIYLLLTLGFGYFRFAKPAAV